MTYTKLFPVAVAEYSAGLIADTIRHTTGWTQRSEVLDKAHLTYLDRYVRKLKAKTIVVENEYIDRHYIEDYAEYYARCFHQHPRTCARIHFFQDEFTEADFVDAITGNNDALLANIQAPKHYIGFVVLRPIPKTCIARMCLRPYDLDEEQVKLVENGVTISLFGVDLHVEASSFLEQDKVVSACATSAIWMLLNAHQKTSPDVLPSPSAITKSAFSHLNDEGRIFPAHGGLKLPQVARSLKAYDLEPTIFAVEQIGKARFPAFVREVIFAYAACNTPVLLGGQVVDCSKDEETILGRHLVCVLGYRAGSGPEALGRSSAIDQLYVHDDRYGPYVALNADREDYFEFRWANGDGEHTVLKEKFIPEAVVVGLYHKVRIDYLQVRNLCVSINELIAVAPALLKVADNGADVSALEKFLACTFVITLETTGAVKSTIRDSKVFSYNGSADKTELLLENLPKYLWRCRYLADGETFIDLLVDATEVPQGNLILGGVLYTPVADKFWRQCKVFANDAEFVSQVTKYCDDRAKPFVSTFVGFFSRKENDALNSYYGPLRLPGRPIRSAEVDSYGNANPIRNRMQLTYREDPAQLMKWLIPGSVYLWLIDEDGHLIVGEEPEAPEGASSVLKPPGHLALSKSGAARIGGDMTYVSGKWALRLKSGAYSGHVKRNDIREQYLKNVIRLNFADHQEVVVAEWSA